jgi:hypothetical protein
MSVLLAVAHHKFITISKLIAGLGLFVPVCIPPGPSPANGKSRHLELYILSICLGILCLKAILR